jgi:aminopeptidase YwaD
MSLFARGLRLAASLLSARGFVVERDTYVPDSEPRSRDLTGVRDRLASLTGLSRHPSHPDLARAADLMSRMFADAGLQVQRDPFQVDGLWFENVIGHKCGASEAAPVLVIGHYDAVGGSPGADDNASGAVGVVEIARCLRNRELVRPVIFVAATLEEYGMHGSIRLAERHLRGGGVHAAMVLEMIAYTAPGQSLPRGLRGRGRGDFLAVVANEPSAFIARSMMVAARRSRTNLPVETLVLAGRGTGLPISRLSDNAPFWDLDMPAVMITDTAFLRNPNYHSPTDTLETLDLGFMLTACELCADAVAALAG